MCALESAKNGNSTKRERVINKQASLFNLSPSLSLSLPHTVSTVQNGVILLLAAVDGCETNLQ